MAQFFKVIFLLYFYNFYPYFYIIIHNFRVVSSIIRNYFAFPDIVKPQAVAPEALRFSYEGGR